MSKLCSPSDKIIIEKHYDIVNESSFYRVMSSSKCIVDDRIIQLPRCGSCYGKHLISSRTRVESTDCNNDQQCNIFKVQWLCYTTVASYDSGITRKILHLIYCLPCNTTVEVWPKFSYSDDNNSHGRQLSRIQSVFI